MELDYGMIDEKLNNGRMYWLPLLLLVGLFA